MIKLFRLLSLVLVCISLLVAIDTPSVSTAQPRPRVIFVHRSVGANLIAQGTVRSLFSDLGFNFWDHGYNGDGLIGPDGKRVEPGFDIPDDNTDPDGFAAIFAQPVHSPPDNTLSHLLTYDVIVFKSCYPVSDIDSDSKLASFKANYLSIRETMDRYPDRLFVVVTPPPNSPPITHPDRAARGRAFANWLKSDEYLKGHPNVFVFDLFDAFADASNNLRAEYQQPVYPMNFTSLRGLPVSLLNAARNLRAFVLRRPLYAFDSHPNLEANRAVGPLFARSVAEASLQFAAQRTDRRAAEPLR